MYSTIVLGVQTTRHIWFACNTRDMQALIDRHKLDRRRLEAAHFHFAILQVAQWYPQYFHIGEIPLHSALDESLPRIAALYRGAFMDKYAGESYCGVEIMLTA